MAKKFYNFPEVPYGVHPKILFVGNGFNLSFPDAQSTDAIIQNQWKQMYGIDLPSRDDEPNNRVWKLPFPLQVVAATKDHVQGCMTELAGNFKGMDVTEEQRTFIKQILDAKFDAILSTNYSLEFEKSTIDNFSERKVYALYKKSKEQTKQQEQLGIFQCTELPYANHPLLWHIHGTALRKNSLIMGQLYYGKLLSEVTEQARKLSQLYKAYEKSHLPFHPKSWIDYFLIGDVYILGFKLDFSESDIWWLLSFKKSMFPNTKVYYYEHSISEEKRLMLDCYQVEMPDNPILAESGKSRYLDFYKAICNGIN